MERVIKRHRFHVLVLGAAALFLVDFHFLDRYAAGYMQADYWRHFNLIVLPFLERFDPGLLFTNHHHNAVLHLHQLASLAVFDLDVSLDAIVIALISVIAAALLFRAADGARFAASSDFLKTLAAAAPALYLFGPNTSVYYEWPLIGLQIYTWAAIALTAVILHSIQVIGVSRARLAALCAAVLFVLISHFSLATLYLAALCGALAAYAVVRRTLDPVAPMALMAALWGSYALALRALVPGDLAGGGAGGAGAILGHLADFELWSVAAHRIVSASVFDVPVIAEGAAATAVLTHPASTLLVLALAAGATLIALRATPGAVISTALILGGFAFLVTSTLARDGASTAQLAFAPRYQLAYLLAASGLLANVLIAGSVLSQRLAGSAAVWPRRVAAALVLGVLVLAMQAAWRETCDRLQYIEVQNDRLELELFMAGLDETAVTLPARIVGANESYEPVLNVLKAKQLNVFAPDYHAGAELRRFQAARTEFLAGESDRVRPVRDLRQVEGEARFACTPFARGAVVRAEVDAARRVGAGVRVISAGEDRLHANVSQGRSVFYAPLGDTGAGRLCVLAGVQLISVQVLAR